MRRFNRATTPRGSMQSLALLLLLSAFGITASHASMRERRENSFAFVPHIQPSRLSSRRRLATMTPPPPENDDASRGVDDPSDSSSGQDEGDDDLQVLRFRDPRSSRPIVLVGSMHYNPVSIRRARSVTESLASSGGLHSVLVESCPTRWRSATDFRSSLSDTPWLRDLYSKLLPSEMQAAASVAGRFDVPVVLGDQPIEVTGERVKAFANATLRDLLAPQDGGWGNVARDLVTALGVVSSSLGLGGGGGERGDGGKDRLSIPDYLDVDLVTRMPFSFARYPLSIALRHPQFAVTLLLLFTLLDQGPLWATSALAAGGGAASASPMIDTVSSSVAASDPSILADAGTWAATILLVILETVAFGRALVLPVLAERDVALARSIAAVANGEDHGEGGRRLMAFDRDRLLPLSYVKPKPGGVDDERAVVAILGMAHCNGVKKLILEGGYDQGGEECVSPSSI